MKFLSAKCLLERRSKKLMSPIRAENRARYPKNWREIRDAIVARAEMRCECMGECGLHRTNPGPRRCTEEHGAFAKWANGPVVLTVAHLNHTPEDCRPENLKAMCQRCHLRYDSPHHAKSRRMNRDKDVGQESLFRVAALEGQKDD